MKPDNNIITYAFLDSQNLNLGIRSLGWQLDYKKFYIYLVNKYKVKKALLFIGYLKENGGLYSKLELYGYTLIFKPAVKDKKANIKGNVDAEIVLHSAKIQYNNYDKAIIVSGDGDFYCLYEELIKDGKLGLIFVPSRKSESSLLKKYWEYRSYVEDIRNRVEYKKMGRIAFSTRLKTPSPLVIKRSLPKKGKHVKF